MVSVVNAKEEIKLGTNSMKITTIKLVKGYVKMHGNPLQSHSSTGVISNMAFCTQKMCIFLSVYFAINLDTVSKYWRTLQLLTLFDLGNATIPLTNFRSSVSISAWSFAWMFNHKTIVAFGSIKREKIL